MKTLKHLILASIFSLLAMSVVSAQKEYTKVSSEDGVEFSYLWKKSKVLKKDSPMILFIQVYNSNTYPASVNFTVEFYWNAIRSASSESQNLCIKAGKKSKGKIKNLTFEKAGYSDQDIGSVNFSLDVSGVSVKKVETCKKSKN